MKQTKRNKVGQRKTSSAITDSSSQKGIVWCFDRIDRNGKFAFDVRRKDFDAIMVLSKMVDLSSLTWQEVLQATHDNKGKNHSISAEDFGHEARKRFRELELHEEEDALFSIAITNIIRLFGIKKGAEFHVLWYDPNHEVCPVRR